ncbi:MAG: signal peptidase II [Propionibacteriaceae bacterium]|jgi:signal peptidase II|nr:signal peptidase II [Propionibacteriaceae bacterium]
MVVAFNIAAVGLAADFCTKVAALAWLDPAHPIRLLGGLVTLRLLRNPGAAFSMGENATPLFTVFAIAALIGVFGWMLPRVRHKGWAVATGLLIAGIAGNLIDRLSREPGPFYGQVIDFIELPYFAVFNVADMCITGAAVLIIWFSVVKQIGLNGKRMAAKGEAEPVSGPESGAGAAEEVDESAREEAREPGDA